MPSQYFTVAKIAGDAAHATKELLLFWQRGRLVDDPNEWAPEQWPTRIREEIDGFADRLRRHSHEPPVVFFVEFVDLWSSAPHFILPLSVVIGDQYEVCFVETPLPSDMKQQLRERERHGQHREDQFFAKMMLEAEEAWNKLVGDSIVVILRRVVGGLVTDDEIEASLSFTPTWIRSTE